MVDILEFSEMKNFDHRHGFSSRKKWEKTMKISDTRNSIRLKGIILGFTWSKVLNFRVVSSFFLSTSSKRLANSRSCFCCSLILDLQVLISLRIDVCTAVYFFSVCLSLRSRLRITTSGSRGESSERSTEQFDGEQSSVPLRDLLLLNDLVLLLDAEDFFFSNHYAY